MILLQIVMVSPGTHLVKNREAQFNNKKSPKLKLLGPLCNETVNLKTDSRLCIKYMYTEIEIINSPSILKHNKD